MEFSHDIALSLMRSEEEFSVDFDVAWQWIGYAKKQNAKDKLIRNFENGIDYLITQMRESAPSGGLTHREEIKLTIDCFKSLGMMAGTAKGKEIRRYFLECERELKQQKLAAVEPTTLDSLRDRIANLWAEAEVAAENAKITAFSALRIARLCGEALLEAKQQVGHGNWEKFRESILHPIHKKPISSATASLYQRVAENWEEKIESSNVKTLRGAQILLREPRGGKQLKPAEELERKVPALSAAPNPEQQSTKIDLENFKEYVQVMREAIDLADRLGGFTNEQRAAIRDQFFGRIQSDILRRILRDCGIDPDSAPNCN